MNEEINKYIDQNSAANKRSFKGYLSKDEENEYDMYNNINDAFLNPHEDTREKILESDEEKISERDKNNEKLKNKSELIKNNKKDNKLGFNLIMPESIDNSAEIFISKEDFNKDSNNLDDKLINFDDRSSDIDKMSQQSTPRATDVDLQSMVCLLQQNESDNEQKEEVE